MALITAALLGLAALTSAVVANTVVPRSQTQNQDWESSEAAINRQFQSQEAQTAREFNSLEAQKQRDFEKSMSDTAIQRQVADMQAAGINPASIGLLGGASTPSASAASFGSAPSGSMVSGSPTNTGYMMNLYNSAVQAAMAKDKNFTNQSIAEMYATNSRQMRAASDVIRKTAYDYRTDRWAKQSKEFSGSRLNQDIDSQKFNIL